MVCNITEGRNYKRIDKFIYKLATHGEGYKNVHSENLPKKICVILPSTFYNAYK